VEENLGHWRDMLEGKHAPGSAVLRVKTDIAHKDPAIRDWAAFRIVDTPHPRPEIHDKYRVWPLLDFESALHDHLLGITHIIRGKDLIDSERRQQYLYKYFNWRYPETLHWGRVKIHEFGKLSTSGMSEAIKTGEYTGWDDPRLPTVRALRRRGIQPEALRTFFIELGVGETDISLSMENLYAENRKIVDKTAKRYFFTPKPVKLTIEGAEPTMAQPLLHPSQEDWGRRSIPVEKEVLISYSDAEKLQEKDLLRLKDLYNIKIIEKNPESIRAEYVSGGIEVVREHKGRIIHWAPPEGLKITVLTPTGIDRGIGEKGISEALDDVVQFERYGFARIDTVEDNTVIAYFTHK
jgi:glutamyl-tRNA synthetase